MPLSPSTQPTIRKTYTTFAPSQSTVPIRSIAEGKANAPLSVGSVDESTNDEEDVEKDSWMEPRQHLDLAPASVSGENMHTWYTRICAFLVACWFAFCYIAFAAAVRNKLLAAPRA